MTTHGHHRPTQITPAARRAAWDAYLCVTADLVPAIQTRPLDDIAVICSLAGLATRIRRHAPLWPPHGPLLIAAVDAAIQARARGDRERLLRFLAPITRGLFSLSRTPPRQIGTS